MATGPNSASLVTTYPRTSARIMAGPSPTNLIALANTESNAVYQRYCSDNGIKPHPARFPVEIPEYFVRMLTNEGDSVVDIFGGSCGTGEVCERLKRKWLCIDLEEDYLRGVLGRFQERLTPRQPRDPNDEKAT
jgi:site-specific DNA-methyltransferase (cytosine-N4-specific)